jgi:uncharacterized delta-60 repeat protein
VAEYNSAGALVTTFGSGGKVTFSVPDDGKSMAIQADGKILVGGHVGPFMVQGNPAITRLLSNGQRDTSFGSSGTSTLAPNGSFRSMVLQPDGKIVGAGVLGHGLGNPSGSAVYRVNP